MELRVSFLPQAAQEMVPRLKRMPQVQVIRASHLIRCRIEHLTRFPEFSTFMFHLSTFADWSESPLLRPQPPPSTQSKPGQGLKVSLPRE